MSAETITGTTQYLTYTLADEVFALDINKVREVLDFTDLTKVPNMPDFMLGVINLRGSVVPVVDLRTRFRMPKSEQTVNTCVIIAEVSVDGDTTVLGCLADSVREVVDLESNQIEPAPKIGTKLRNEFIRGMGKHNNQFIIILDIDKVFSADEVLLAEIVGAGAECPLIHHQAA
ncbi:MAG: chemotaxis protein CheW [Nitrospirota bacterium]|nr:chemotaxis protein CheW [Nitrospirota bacterium]